MKNQNGKVGMGSSIFQRAMAWVTALAVAAAVIVIPLPLDSMKAHAASGSWSSFAASGYAGGDGSAANPYQIANAEQLAFFANQGIEHNGEYFVLKSNIDLSDHLWAPISAFIGTFDGGGHKITGVYMNDLSDARFIGFFAMIGPGGIVENVGVDVDIASGQGTQPCIGGLVGSNDGTILNCFTTGTVDARYSYASSTGGLVGESTTGVCSIINCYSTANVTGGTAYSNIGGLVGWGSYIITNCYATGNVTYGGNNNGYKDDIGGLAGHFTYGTITNCYWNNTIAIGVNGAYDTERGLSALPVSVMQGAAASITYIRDTSGGTAAATNFVDALNGGRGAISGVSAKYWGAGSNGGYPVFADSLSKLSAPTGLAWSGTTATWNSTAGAASYNVLLIQNYVGVGSVVNATGTSWNFSSMMAVNKNGIYTFMVTAIADPSLQTNSDPTWINDPDGYLYPKLSNVTTVISLGTGNVRATCNKAGILYLVPAGTYANKAALDAVSGKVTAAATVNTAVNLSISGLLQGYYQIYGVDSAGSLSSSVSVTIKSGDGSKNNPYVISTASEMNDVRNNVSAYYELGNDIDLSSYTSWVPIGSFTGTLNGNGHKIVNLKIGTSAAPDTAHYNVGLFGLIGSGGIVENMGVEASVYSSYASAGNANVGGLAGDNFNGAIINCYTTGSVTGSAADSACASLAGGLVGTNGGTIANCYSTADVTGGRTSYGIGGLVGANYDGTYNSTPVLVNCYSTGNLTSYATVYLTYQGRAYVGGSIGNANNSNVTNCYWNSTASQKVNGNEIATKVGETKSLNFTSSDTLLGLTSIVMKGSASSISYKMNTGGTKATATSLIDALNGGCGAISNLPTGVTAKYWGADSANQNNGYPVMLENASKLATPTSLVWSGKTAAWSSVGNAMHYSVQFYKNGSAVSTPLLITDTSTDLSGLIAANKGGSYTFTVTAIGNGVTFVNSSLSSASGSYVYPVLSNVSAMSSSGSGSVSATGNKAGTLYLVPNGTYADKAALDAVSSKVTASAAANTAANIAATGLTAGHYLVYFVDTANDLSNSAPVVLLSGGGTSGNPYLITTPDELNDVRINLGACYKLNNDIDLSGYTSWVPIGNNTNVFSGTLDGAGFKVTNLTIGSSSDPNSSLTFAGLFGYAGSSAVIKNIGVDTSIYSSVGTGAFIGGLAGRSQGTITNCYATGNVTGNSYYIGGLVGLCGGTTTNCYATGNVTGGDSSYIGGFTGYITSGTITANCYATGNVTGGSNSRVGGFTGISSSGKITNCYTTGNVTGGSNAFAGGFAGTANSSIYTNCFWNSTASQKINGTDVSVKTGIYKIYSNGNIETSTGLSSDVMKGIATGTIPYENGTAGTTATSLIEALNGGRGAITSLPAGVTAQYWSPDAGTSNGSYPVLTDTSVVVTPSVMTLEQGSTQTFAAAIYGAGDNTVTWSLTGASAAGTAIDSGTGLLTVAPDESAAGLTVIAASTAYSGTSGRVNVTVAASPLITISGNLTNPSWAKSIHLSITASAYNLSSVTVTDPSNHVDDITSTYLGGYTVSQNGTYLFKVTSASGQSAAFSAVVSRIDTAAPTDVTVSFTQDPIKTVAHFLTFGLFFKDTVTVNLSANDAGSGVDYYQYQTVAEDAVFDADGVWQTTNSSFSISSAFKGTIYARAVDKISNISSHVTKSLAVDSIIPVIQADSNSLVTTDPNASVPVTVNDSGAGVGMIAYQINGGTPYTIDLTTAAYTDLTKQYVFSIGSLPDGDYDIVINAQDNSGNAADTVTVHVSKDTTPKVSSVTVNPDTMTVSQGLSQAFTAVVSGINNPGTAVNWSVSGNESVNTTIDTDGKLIVASDETAALVTVRATSAVDSTKSAAAIVTVTKRTITGIVMKTNPSKTSYIEGQSLDLTGAAITASYDNGTTADVTVTSDLVSGYDSAKLGSQTVTVTYDGQTTSFSVTVAAKTITGIVMKTSPSKTSYIEGQSLDLTGAAITVNYDNGTAADVAVTSDLVSGYDSAKLGSQTVTVTYAGQTTSFSVTVAAKTITGIVMKTSPSKTSYIEGQSLDLTGAVITVTYDNGTTADVDVSSDLVSGYDSAKLGLQTVTVTYNGTTSFNVTVTGKTITGIIMKTNPSKTSYIEGQSLDLTGAAITASYNNGTAADVTVTSDLVSGYDSAKPGLQTVTVTYDGKAASFSVTVTPAAVTAAPTDVTVTPPVATAAPTDVTVTPPVATAAPTDVTVTPPDVNEDAKTITGIVMKSNPAKTSYIAGQSINLTGAAITASYDNGMTADVTVTSTLVSGYDSTKPGLQTVTVTYDGKTTNFKVHVIAMSITTPDNFVLDLTDVILPNDVTSVSLVITAIPRTGSESNDFAVIQQLINSNTSLGIINELTVYDLVLVDQNGSPIEQIAGKIKITIPVPSDMSGTLNVLWYNPADNTLMDMSATQENGYLVFEADHLGDYVIVQVSTSATLDANRNPQSDINYFYFALGSFVVVSLGVGIYVVRKKRLFRAKK